MQNTLPLKTVKPDHEHLMTTLLRKFGQYSDSVRLGFERGFDSGEMMDRIYANHPSGRYGVGWLGDWFYLNQSGCRGLRGRKDLLKFSLRQILTAQRALGIQPFILDIASGPGTYLVEALAAENGGVQALCRDLDENGLRRGRALAGMYRLGNIRYEQANAFDEASLQTVSPRPTIIVSSGFYEILTDGAMIRRSMQIVGRVLDPGGTFIFTTQVNHPQLKLIANSLVNREGKPWVMVNRPVADVEQWAREAGFATVATSLEPSGIFGVSVARFAGNAA
ncbi:MAG: class I SAM-dependent methyltransferase family protein [Chloroflexi bacterium]|nr:class I SAM-dependent methyltransferase family protein [Chloroflexota bacterium]